MEPLQVQRPERKPIVLHDCFKPVEKGWLTHFCILLGQSCDICWKLKLYWGGSFIIALGYAGCLSS